MKLLPNLVLSDISTSIKRGISVALIGPMGSGKSSFLYLLLKELTPESGSLNINGSVSYSLQEPWIFPGTFRENILFEEPMNRARFNKIIEACDLKVDLDQFPDGETMNIGEKGSLLSGGQKTRIK